MELLAALAVLLVGISIGLIGGVIAKALSAVGKVKEAAEFQKQKYGEKKEFGEAQEKMKELVSKYLPDIDTEQSAEELVKPDRLEIVKEIGQNTGGGHKTYTQNLGGSSFEPLSEKHAIKIKAGSSKGIKTHELTHMTRRKLEAEQYTPADIKQMRSTATELETAKGLEEKSKTTSRYERLLSDFRKKHPEQKVLKEIGSDLINIYRHGSSQSGTWRAEEGIERKGKDFIDTVRTYERLLKEGDVTPDEFKKELAEERKAFIEHAVSDPIVLGEGAARYIESKTDSETKKAYDKNLNVSEKGYTGMDLLLAKKEYEPVVYLAGHAFFKGLEEKYGEEAATYAALTASSEAEAEGTAEDYSKGISIKDRIKEQMRKNRQEELP